MRDSLPTAGRGATAHEGAPFPEVDSTPNAAAVLARLAVPLAAFAAMASFAARELDRGGAAETGYLAVLATAALLAVGALAPAPAFELGLGAVLATTAVWSLPPGPSRGAVVVLLLAVCLGVAAARRLARTLPELSVAVAVPLALGLQVLLRGDLLLAPRLDLRTVVALVGLPVAAGLATASLARSHGGLALLAAAGAVLLAPGWNVAATLALVALAAGDLLSRAKSWPARAAALALLLAPIAWEPRAGLLAAAAGLALWRPRWGLLAAGVLAAASLLPIAPMAALATGSLAAWLPSLLLLPLLLPALVLPAPDRWPWIAAGLFLAVAARAVPGPAALAAPLALAALALRPAGCVAPFQRVWPGAAVLGTCLLASYPWLRASPLSAALDLVGPRALAAVLAVALALAVHGLETLAARPQASFRRVPSGLIAAGAIFLGLLLHLPAPARPLLPLENAVKLDAARPAWEIELPPQRVAGLVVDSTLENGAALPPGTTVALVRFSDRAGNATTWPLRAGEGTGEWATRRPDVARRLAAAGRRPPEGWVSWVAGGFFGQRYREAWRLAPPALFTHLRVERESGLPADVGLALFQVEVQR
ncbi:MAG TPA: hypothetical protein VOA87_11445 [Thermoanaerobaculia bacterium]|nr:hypothetical protein [Thermoanaerobaculia bacterium]